jgi:NAD(P)-dependent dehydrogenase (short-subunit alcohol dehydrogenase family)
MGAEASAEASKVALITGAASGIGAAVARALAKRGDRVVIADVDATAGSQTAEEIGGTFVATDVRDPAASKVAVAAAEDAYGWLDLVMLNAGIGPHEGPVEEILEETYRRTVAVNIDGVFFGLQAAIPALRRSGGGSIVATASLAGLVATPPTPVYGLTKHAVVGLVRSAAVPLAAQGITLAAIAPGFADTAIIAHELARFEAANFPLLTAQAVAAVVLEAFEGPAGAIWPIQPGRPSEPYAFRGVPGPRAEGFTGQLPEGLFE